MSRPLLAMGMEPASKTHYPVALLSALAIAACSASAPSESGAPSEATLCRLALGHSKVTDAHAVLGKPTAYQTLPDGSGFIDYQYHAGSGILDLQLYFGADQVLSGATTLNIPRPACWRTAISLADAGP